MVENLKEIIDWHPYKCKDLHALMENCDSKYCLACPLENNMNKYYNTEDNKSNTDTLN